jgi:hypothetical protein
MLPLASCSVSPSLTSIAITPNAVVTVSLAPPGVPQGYSQYTAIGYYTRSGHTAQTEDITNQVTWASSTPQVATISSTGVATATGFSPVTGLAWVGNTTISASMPGFGGDIVSNDVTFTVTSCTICTGTSTEPITGLSISPSTDSVALPGQTGQFIALGISGTTGLPTNLTTLVSWSSSNAGVATIGATTGLATAVGQGTTQITALYTNPDRSVVAATATFTVTGSTSEPLQSIAITPVTESILAGQTSQLIAIGTFAPTAATPGTQNLTSTVKWNSSNASVASITSPGGLLTAVGPGDAVITAIATNPDNSVVTATATVTVTGGSSSSEPLISLAIIPDSQSVAGPGQINQFLAIGTFSSTSSTPGTQNMANIPTYTVTWYSSNPSVATISNTAPNAGVATAVGQGTTAITAIAVNNADKSASYATASFTVTGAASNTITGLSIFPGSQSIVMPEIGQPNPTVNLIVIGTYGSGLQANVTPQMWTSSNPQVLPTANIVSGANTTVATAIGPGTTTITASYTNVVTPTNPVSNVVTATATLTVANSAAEPLLSLAIIPNTPTAPFPTQTTQLTAVGTFSEAPVTQNLTKTVTWSSSNPLVATVCNATATNTVPASCATTPGLVTAVGQGTAAITATATSATDGSFVYATVPYLVQAGSQQQMSALTIVPSSLALSATGQPGSLIALGTSTSTGLQVDVTASPQMVWTSSNVAIATVSSALAPTQTCTTNNAVPPVQTCTNDAPGVVKGVSAGSTNITAEFINTPAAGSTPAVVVTAQASVNVASTPAAEPLLSIVALPSATTDLNLEGNAQYLAYGTFSTAPTTLDITNGFFHAGFPNSSCTAAYAFADAATVAEDSAANLPVTNLPYAQCTFVPVTWISTAPYIFPINSAGTAGATGGLATADGSGNTNIYAVAANPDATLVYSPIVVFNCPYKAPTYGTITVTLPNGTTTTTTDYSDLLDPGTCNTITIADSLLSTLTVFNAGVNTSGWLITAPSATGTPDVIHCGGSVEQATLEGSVCEATYPNGTLVILTAPAEPGASPAVNFGGWSEGCTPCTLAGGVCTTIAAPPFYTAAGPNYCKVVVGGGCTLNVNTGTYTCTNSSNMSVGAVFN